MDWGNRKSFYKTGTINKPLILKTSTFRLKMHRLILPVSLIFSILAITSVNSYRGILLHGGSCARSSVYDPNTGVSTDVQTKLKSYYHSAAVVYGSDVYVIGWWFWSEQPLLYLLKTIFCYQYISSACYRYISTLFQRNNCKITYVNKLQNVFLYVEGVFGRFWSSSRTTRFWLLSSNINSCDYTNLWKYQMSNNNRLK